MMQHTMREMKYSPIVVFTYTRLEHLTQTIESLKSNIGAENTVLYVVSDGPAKEEDRAAVWKLRDYIDEVTGFREIVRIYRDKNLGPLNSPLLAEQAVINDHGSVISLEDDNITATNFIVYMNQALCAFEHDDRIYSIGAYVPSQLQAYDDTSDFWLYPWNISWGYAVHKAQYNKIHPLTNRYREFARNGILRRQNSAGGLFVTDSLRRDFKRQKNLADAIIATEMFSRGMRTVLPTKSKVKNIGQDGTGQSSKLTTDRYETLLDESGKLDFDFSTPSMQSDLYCKRLISFQNGSLATQLTRRIGMYHTAERLKMKFGRYIRKSNLL